MLLFVLLTLGSGGPGVQYCGKPGLCSHAGATYRSLWPLVLAMAMGVLSYHPLPGSRSLAQGRHYLSEEELDLGPETV